MIHFLKRAETQDINAVDGNTLELIAGDFNLKWKGSIGAINEAISQTFPNFQNGAKILHAALSQYILIYKRFISLWERKFTNVKPKVSPVGIQTLLVEIKKYRSTF